MPDEEIDQLLTKAELRLKAAQHLLMNEYYDDAVSCTLLQLPCFSPGIFQAKTHRGLVARFGQEFVEKGLVEKHFARILRIAMELRSEADYSISREISEEEAAVTVDDAERFLAKAKEVIAKFKEKSSRL